MDAWNLAHSSLFDNLGRPKERTKESNENQFAIKIFSKTLLWDLSIRFALQIIKRV